MAIEIEVDGLTFTHTYCQRCHQERLVHRFYLQLDERRCTSLLCLPCVSTTPWFAGLKRQERWTLSNAYGRAFTLLRAERDLTAVDLMLLKSFGPERWTALEAGGL
jgi:hypothetical protein